jgi:hypothetical protein
MIAVSDPAETDRLRQLVGFDLAAAAERIALALHDQRGTTQVLEVRGA